MDPADKIRSHSSLKSLNSRHTVTRPSLALVKIPITWLLLVFIKQF